MALSDSRWQRTSTLCAMYVAQGIPWGFMATTMGAYLADQGMTDEALSKLTAVILLPWTFKLIWAPLIDTFTFRSMGRRRPWIIGAELMMAVSLFGILVRGEDLDQDLQILWWMFFLHNCFASMQDVATDALAVDILPPHEQGLVNGLMWGSKLIGRAIATAGLATVIKLHGLGAAILVQFVSLIVLMMFPLLIVERKGERRFPWSRGEAKGESAASMRPPREVIADLLHAFSPRTMRFFFIYGITHIVGWGIIEVITKTLYMQKLGWEFDRFSHMSAWGVLPEMTGALLGGFLADRFGRRLTMILGYTLYGLLAAIFGLLPQYWEVDWFSAGYLVLNPGFLALGSVGFLSMGMRISWTRAAGTVFTIFMTISNIAHVVGNRIAGPVREALDYERSFLVACVTMIVPLAFLVFVRPQEVDDRRDDEANEESESSQ